VQEGAEAAQDRLVVGAPRKSHHSDAGGLQRGVARGRVRERSCASVPVGPAQQFVDRALS
jgi:hypothetical protein